jgi:cell division protein FtsQ
MTVDERERVVSLAGPPWRRRLRRTRPWVIVTAVAVLLGFAVWVVEFSSWLGLQTVEVRGATGPDVSTSQVVQAAAVDMGTPLARIDLSAVRRRVETIPAVARASVTRSWPHAVVVSVTERQPIALIHRDGTWWVMDKTGTPFAKAGARTPSQPIVQLIGSPRPGTLREVGSVLAVLPADLLSDTKRVTASSMDSITLMLKNGSEVRWGDAGNSSEKVAVLHALLDHKAQVYDVTIPSEPATSGH